MIDLQFSNTMREYLPALFEVLLCHPHLVECFERGDNTAADPAGVLPVVRCNQHRLDLLRDELLDLLVKALAEVCH